MSPEQNCQIFQLNSKYFPRYGPQREVGGTSILPTFLALHFAGMFRGWKMQLLVRVAGYRCLYLKSTTHTMEKNSIWQHAFHSDSVTGRQNQRNLHFENWQVIFFNFQIAAGEVRVDMQPLCLLFTLPINLSNIPKSLNHISGGIYFLWHPEVCPTLKMQYFDLIPRRCNSEGAQRSVPRLENPAPQIPCVNIYEKEKGDMKP